MLLGEVIAADFLRSALQALQARYPQLPMTGVGIDFSTALALPPQAGSGTRLMFYPGSSIGNFLLVVASAADDITAGSLVVSDLVARRALMQGPWLKAAFVFLLVGYGTKMGLVPMHTWLPDAHSEAPSPVSALLSGALLNCAFLGILRAHSICVAAGLGDFSGGILIFFGVLTMLIAAAFIVGQTDFKRLLAYSSIEHMGLLALGAGGQSLDQDRGPRHDRRC